jgi:lipoate-protein ligase A
MDLPTASPNATIPPEAQMGRGCTRLLPTNRLGGRWQMAIDAWMLGQGKPALRLYHWQRPCLSLGRHQHRLRPGWLELAASGRIELVRRPTGGMAVLHGGDLTYALVWPNPPANRVQAYGQVCHWLEQSFAQLGAPLQPGREQAGLAAASCFSTSTAADLVHRDGGKRIGSAQLWRRGMLLQHGSIQLNPNPQLWQELFGAAAPQLAGLPCSDDELECLLLAQAERLLPLPPLRREPLGGGELATIADRLNAYGVLDADGAWASDTSPEASRPRTT